MSKIKYKATYVPDEPKRKDWLKKGFNSEKEAWDYAIKHFCGTCKRYWKNDILKSSCAAEWWIEKYEEK